MLEVSAQFGEQFYLQADSQKMIDDWYIGIYRAIEKAVRMYEWMCWGDGVWQCACPPLFVQHWVRILPLTTRTQNEEYKLNPLAFQLSNSPTSPNSSPSQVKKPSTSSHRRKESSGLSHTITPTHHTITPTPTIKPNITPMHPRHTYTPYHHTTPSHAHNHMHTFAETSCIRMYISRSCGSLNLSKRIHVVNRCMVCLPSLRCLCGGFR